MGFQPLSPILCMSTQTWAQMNLIGHTHTQVRMNCTLREQGPMIYKIDILANGNKNYLERSLGLCTVIHYRSVINTWHATPYKGYLVIRGKRILRNTFTWHAVQSISGSNAAINMMKEQSIDAFKSEILEWQRESPGQGPAFTLP